MTTFIVLEIRAYAEHDKMWNSMPFFSITKKKRTRYQSEWFEWRQWPFFTWNTNKDRCRSGGKSHRRMWDSVRISSEASIGYWQIFSATSWEHGNRWTEPLPNKGSSNFTLTSTTCLFYPFVMFVTNFFSSVFKFCAVLNCFSNFSYRSTTPTSSLAGRVR